MAEASGPSAFEMSQRMGPGHGGMGGSNIGIMKSLFGIGGTEDQFLVNLSGGEKSFKVTGFGDMNEGLLAKIFAMRGEGFFGRLLDAFASGQEAFTSLNDIGGGGQHVPAGGHPQMGGHPSGSGSTSSSSEGGSNTGGNSGSNRPFSGLPSMSMAGPISSVPPYMMGHLTPDATPSMGSRGAGMGMSGGGVGAGM